MFDMNEELILDKVLDVLENEGCDKAYTKLIEALKTLKEPSSRLYYFLACLAVSSKKPEEAIRWLSISIEEKEQWNKPAIFDDSDFDSIRNDERFKKLISISNERYERAMINGKVVCTLSIENKNISKNESDKLALILHGNNQNNEVSKNYWENVFSKNVEVHYLQSPDVESQNRFSWSNKKNYSSGIISILEKSKWNTCSERIICGFSAACNVILNLILADYRLCEKVIMLAPWIPCINKSSDKLIENILKHNINLFILCGEKDEQCIGMVKNLESLVKNKNGKITVKYLKNLGHTYPKDLDKIIAELLYKEKIL